MTARYTDTPTSYMTVAGNRIAYRTLGDGTASQDPPGLPLVALTHLAATMDQWDPQLLDSIAARRPVIVMDLPGVGGSEGRVANTIPGMAIQTLEIMDALGVERCDLLGLSMGGMIAQELVRLRPSTVRRLVLVGTAPRGGRGVKAVPRVTVGHMLHAAVRRVDPKRFIFYPHDAYGATVASEVLGRMAQRRPELADAPMGVRGFITQLRAIRRWGAQPADPLTHVQVPTLIVNGDRDRQVPTENSLVLHERIAGSWLEIMPRAGHGSLFQYPERFVELLNEFLDEDSRAGAYPTPDR